jgi:hypothetical protein
MIFKGKCISHGVARGYAILWDSGRVLAAALQSMFRDVTEGNPASLASIRRGVCGGDAAPQPKCGSPRSSRSAAEIDAVSWCRSVLFRAESMEPSTAGFE